MQMSSIHITCTNCGYSIKREIYAFIFHLFFIYFAVVHIECISEHKNNYLQQKYLGDYIAPSSLVFTWHLVATTD